MSLPLAAGALTFLAFALGALLLSSVVATIRFYQGGVPDRPLLPMTVIRPLKGADPGLSENLRSLIDADRELVLQTIFAMESADDPAYPICRSIVEAYPHRDVEIAITGPSGRRMGKAHNMIEALKRSRHALVIFSDSDVRAGREVLLATSAEFEAGADAISAMPNGSVARAPTDALLGACFNHYFFVPAALLFRSGRITPMAGGWLACRKAFLERIGGLETLADRAAEDISIALEAKRIGAKTALLRVLAPIREHGGSPVELALHMLKWAKIIRFSTPAAFASLPLLDLCFVAACAWALGASWKVPIAAFAWRVSLAFLQDLAVAGLFPLWLYLALPVLDFACVGIWAAALCSNTIEWRGKSYRLRAGGRLEVLAP